MNKKEIERMIALTDDRYIEELYTEKLGVRKRHPTLWITAAAIIAIAVGGINYFVSTLGNDDKIISENAVIAEARPEDYSVYFQNRKDGVSDVLLAEKDIPLYVVTDKSVLVKTLPFDTSDIFTITADVVCDDNNEQYAAEVKFSYSPESTVNIIMCDDGRLSEFDTENAVPEKMGGVDVYGFDAGGGDRYTCLEAYFVSNGTEYVVTGRNTDCNKLGDIIYGLIYSGYNARSIDASGARSDVSFRSEEMSIEQANRIEPFAGLVPLPQDGFVLYRGVICTFSETYESSKPYSMTVSFADVPPLPNTNYNKLISLEYDTEYKGDNGQLRELPRLSDITAEDIKSVFGNGDNLTVKCGELYITVYAENCSAEEIWQYVDMIKSNDKSKDDTYPTVENYGVYFKDAGFNAIIDYTLDAGGESHNFISEYAAGLMSFDTTAFDDGQAIVYCDGKGKPVNASVNLYCPAMARDYGVSIVISDEGKVYPGHDFEETEPMKRSGVDIYGYTLGEAGGGFKNMCACFVSEGIGYSVDFRGMSYDEAISIIDSLIEDGLKASDFDLSQGSPAGEDPYAAYFRQVDTSERIRNELSLDICGNEYRYDEEYTREILRRCFDTSRFPDIIAYMYCDENGRQVNGDIDLLNSLGTEPNAPFYSIRFSMDGEQFNYYDMKDPKELCGVQVYGVEEIRQDDTEKALYLDFNSGGISYSLYFYRMSYEDAIGIAAGIIKNGLSVDDFDPSQAEYSMNTERIDADRLNELNNDSVFAGYILTADSIGDMKLFSGDGTGSYVTEWEKGKNDTYETFSLHLPYEADKENETDIGKFIALNYHNNVKTHIEDSQNSLPSVKLDSLTRESLDDFVKFDVDGRIVRFDFEITTGNSFYINVQGQCTPDEMWKCLCLIEPKLADKENTDGMEISAEEANEKNKFKEHIPRSASIDGLTADKAVKYYPVTIGDTVIIDGVTSHDGFGMDYEFKGENGFISLKYGDYNISVGDVELPLKAIGESQLTREMLEKHFEQPSEHEGNRKYSYMWVQFYSGSWVIINADCAPETLWKCLGEMSVYAKEPDENTVYYNGMAYSKSDLSEETLEWLENYNNMNYIEQLSVSYMPYDLVSAQKNN